MRLLCCQRCRCSRPEESSTARCAWRLKMATKRSGRLATFPSRRARGRCGLGASIWMCASVGARVLIFPVPSPWLLSLLPPRGALFPAPCRPSCTYLCVSLTGLVCEGAQVTVQGDYLVITNQYASRQNLVLTDEGFVFLGSRGTSIAVCKVRSILLMLITRPCRMITTVNRPFAEATPAAGLRWSGHTASLHVAPD